MIVAITFLGASTFLVQEILKNKGYVQLSKTIFPTALGITSIIILWWITKVF